MLAAFVFVLYNASLQAAEKEKPNIILILIDDLGWPAISSFGNTHVQTKHIDRLAEEGMKFTHAYVTPQCTPTRASLITGQNTARNNMWHVIARYCYPNAYLREPAYKENLSRDAYTLGEALKDNGYKTGIVGKWHLNSHTKLSPEPDGYYTRLFPEASSYYGFDQTDHLKGEYQAETDKGVQALTDEAIHFIRENRDTTFFLYFSHHTIHGPVLAVDSLITKYTNLGYPEKGVNNVTYLAAIEHFDNTIGQLLDSLDSFHLTENTMLVFLTDNGGVSNLFSNAPLRAGKGSPYEGGIRVPMIVRWPGVVEARSTCEVPVHVCDLYPSFVNIAGGRMGQQWPLDGEDITGLLTQEGGIQREALYWYLPLYDMLWGATPSAVIRKGDYKLIHYFGDFVDTRNNNQYIIGERTELYDLSSDLGEIENLAESHTLVRDELLSDLTHWIDSMNPPRPVQNMKYNADDPFFMPPKASCNMLPFVSNPIADMEMGVGKSVEFVFEEAVFTDYDLEELNYRATDEYGNPLPAWVQFYAKERKFVFTPTKAGAISIRLSANDHEPEPAIDHFRIIVSK